MKAIRILQLAKLALAEAHKQGSLSISQQTLSSLYQGRYNKAITITLAILEAVIRILKMFGNVQVEENKSGLKSFTFTPLL